MPRSRVCAWIRRVIRAESAGRTMLGGRPIVSSAGAMGLMQLMPATWAHMRALLGLGTNPHDPRDNILAGTAYLRMMYDRFGYPGLFAAYNAGPGRYARHLATGSRLPGETIAYVMFTSRNEAGELVGATIMPPGRIDRSPCGTGNSARLAVAAAKGEAKPGDSFVARSIIGSRFDVEFVEETRVGDRKAVMPRIMRNACVMSSQARTKVRIAMRWY